MARGRLLYGWVSFSFLLAACAPAVAGTLRYSGGWTHTGPRAATDAWLVYSFEAHAGDEVTAYVRSSAGAPAARLVDDGRHPLADSTIGHPDGDTIAVVTSTASRTGTYYLLLRDTARADATFEVQLGGGFTCRRDADCERAGEATGDPKRPSPGDIVPFCMIPPGAATGVCKGMTRESVEPLRAR